MKFASLSKIAVPLGVVGIIMLLVVPVPAALLDVLIAVSILLALVILLTTMFVKRPLDFSVFPSLLLVATLLRLGLNVASTRLVLGNGYAGEVIAAFGSIAVGGSLIIGCVIFLILIVIQFVVVTKGAERVAEVGARFTLDAMPGKQMAIDADLNAGLITDSQARERRAEVAAEADFYGAMDGASKFVKGDAIAGLIIIIINLVGGIAIGMLQRGMGISEALNTYALLTIGDGLATQIPALLMAVSTGMIVTRSNASSDMGSTASKQLAQSRTALLISGSAAIALALVPGMPKLPFILIGALLILTAQRIKSNLAKSESLAEVARQNEAAVVPTETTEDLIEKMRVHALEIQLAPDLVDVVNGEGTTCWPASAPCAAAWRWRWALCCRRCAPATRWTCPLPPTPSGSPGWRPGAAPLRAGRCWPWASTWIRCPVPRSWSRSSGWPASGCRPSCGTMPRWQGPPPSTGSR